MVNSPKDAFGDEHLDWFRMTLIKMQNLPDHMTVPLIKRMLSTITDKVVEKARAGYQESRK